MMDDSMDWMCYADVRSPDHESEGTSVSQYCNSDRCGYDGPVPVSIAYSTEQRDGEPFSEDVAEISDGSLEEGEVPEWMKVGVLVLLCLSLVQCAMNCAILAMVLWRF